jgi:hypothetical protein
MMRRIEIDVLPTYSEWPARLLALEKFEQRVKTKAEVDREYQRDKWGSLLADIRKQPDGWSLARADEYFLMGAQTACSAGDALYVGDALEAHAQYVDAIAQRISRFLPAKTVAELGAGYGSIALGLARRGALGNAGLVAAEYAPSGIECLARIARAERIRALTGACDFTLPHLTEMEIPRGALLYTCMAVPYVPVLPDSFVDGMIGLAPEIVLHFEPCIDHFGESLLGLLRTKYTRLNDYNHNLLGLLRRRETAGDLSIIYEEPCFFGENCLLPCSFIAWRPRHGGRNL